MDKMIYINSSIPEELCQDFELYTKSNIVDMKINNTLNTELEEHIQKYKNIIKNRKCYEYNNMPHIKYAPASFKINEKTEKELLQYLWVLDDGDIIIQKKTYLVKKGDIIIFPNSWVFPYKLNFNYIN
jgi:hypothetical protein